MGFDGVESTNIEGILFRAYTQTVGRVCVCIYLCMCFCMRVCTSFVNRVFGCLRFRVSGLGADWVLEVLGVWG